MTGLLAPPEMTWASLRFPREITTSQGFAALLTLTGSSALKRRQALLFEVAGSESGIVHRLRCTTSRAAGLHRQLLTALPGLSVDIADEEHPVEPLDCQRAWRAWQSSRRRSLNLDQAEVVARSLLAALSHVRRGEQLVLQWWLGPVRRPEAVANQVSGSFDGNVVLALGRAALHAPEDLDSDAVRALRAKRSLPGWAAVLRLGVTAEGIDRQRQLLGGLSAAVRQAQGAGVELGFDGMNPRVFNERQLPWRWRLHINVGELLGLSALPLGDVSGLPVARVASRQLPPTRALARHGHVLGSAGSGESERPVAVSVADALKHVHLTGATGSGKSTVILNCVVQDMAAGRSVLLIEPQGDLTADVLARVPRERWDDVVVIDPTSDRPVGLNPLNQPGVPGELVADQLLAVFKGLWPDSWGPRTQDILTAGLLTLVGRPGVSLVALPLLFSDASFRSRLLAQGLSDRLGLGPFWSAWEAMAPGEQASALAAPMNKLRQFLVRPRLRRVIGQPSPAFDLRELFSRRRIVLFDLKKGLMGPEPSALLGSLAISQVWQSALARVAVPHDQRAPVFAYVDEFQDYIHLPQDFSDVLAQARKLGLGVTLSHQNLAQITNQTLKSAVLVNARSRLVFSTAEEDAAVYARSDPRLSPEDVTGLAAYEAYASLLSGNQAQPYVSLRTAPPSDALHDPAEVRAHAAQRWGRPAADIDAALEALVGLEVMPEATATDNDLEPVVEAKLESRFGVTPRRSGPKAPKGGTS